MRPVPWRKRRAAIRHIAPVEVLVGFDQRLIARLQNAPGHCLPRSALKRTYWRPGASHVDYTIDRLIAADFITSHAGLLYPFSRAAFTAWPEAQKRPRRPVPVSTFP
jgi:hypothetical protein